MISACSSTPSLLIATLAGFRSRWTTLGLVGGFEPPGDLARQRQQALDRELADVPQERRQILALDGMRIVMS